MNPILAPRSEHAGLSPAEVYDACFVPALFRPWAPIVCDAANLRSGQRVLDVACGTGALTVVAAAHVGPDGAVIGIDANPEMLAVARRKRPDIEWRNERAETLPYADASFDAVVSQFGLMFFDDRVAALREMKRVLRPGGRLAVAVCDSIDRSPGYSALAALLDRLFGKRAGDALRSPFELGDAATLHSLCDAAGVGAAMVTQREGTVRFGSIDALVSTERACAWTLGGLLDDAQFERLAIEARSVLRPFVDRDGTVAFALPALLVVAAKT